MNAITSMVAQLSAVQSNRLSGAPLRAEITRLARAGTSQRAIAHRLGVSRTYVFVVLRKARKS